MPGRGFEKPFVDFALTALKIFADLNRIGATVRFAQVAAVRGVEAWMSDRELKKSARLQNATSIRLMNAVAKSKEASGNDKSTALAT